MRIAQYTAVAGAGVGAVAVADAGVADAGVGASLAPSLAPV